MKHTKTKQKSLEEKLEDEIIQDYTEVKREWRHFVKFKDENQLLFAAFVVVMLAAVVINTVYILNRDGPRIIGHSNFVPAVSDASKVLTSLQTGISPATTVKISNVTEQDATDYAFTLDPNELMLLMDISITNTSNRNQRLTPVNQLFVRSDEGDQTALHASMYVKNPLPDVELAPGKTATGKISFNVPKRVAHPLLYVDLGWDQQVPIVFDALR